MKLRIKITRDKPSGAISGIQNLQDGQIEYAYQLPDTCQLSKLVSKHLFKII